MAAGRRRNPRLMVVLLQQLLLLLLLVFRALSPLLRLIRPLLVGAAPPSPSPLPPGFALSVGLRQHAKHRLSGGATAGIGTDERGLMEEAARRHLLQRPFRLHCRRCPHGDSARFSGRGRATSSPLPLGPNVCAGVDICIGGGPHRGRRGRPEVIGRPCAEPLVEDSDHLAAREGERRRRSTRGALLQGGLDKVLLSRHPTAAGRRARRSGRAAARFAVRGGDRRQRLPRF